jgi:2-polyprenyl-3-methyl-5-hydroxy-6-metoxy-1,4-benzoquinol methylase
MVMGNRKKQVPIEYLDKIKEQYEIERNYAAQIKRAPKYSDTRKNLLHQAYTEVTKIQLTYPSYLAADYDFGAYLAPVITNLPLSGKKVLEVGCGTGSLCVALAEKGFSTTGIDLSATRIDKAKDRAKQAKQDNCEFMVCNMMEANLPDADFDLVVNDNVLEHIPSDESLEFILRCKAKLKSGGWLITITPNRLVGPYDISRYFLPRGTVAQGLHLLEYTFTELYALMNGAGFGKLYTLPTTACIAARLGLNKSLRFWCYKSILMEILLRIIPGPWRSPRLFRVLVSDIILARN